MPKQFYLKQFSLEYVTTLNVKTVQFQVIQFSVCTQFSSLTIDRALSGATTPGQSSPESDDYERVLCISQSSSDTGISPSDFLMSYP